MKVADFGLAKVVDSYTFLKVRCMVRSVPNQLDLGPIDYVWYP